MVQVTSMPMRKTMQELQAAAAVLNAESDQLNEIIADFEGELEDAGVGVGVWLGDLLEESPITRPKDDDGGHPIEVRTGWQLGYSKVDGKWRVSARFVRQESPVDSTDYSEYLEREPVALEKAPRLVRVAAAPKLERLAEALTEKMRNYIDGISRAKKQAKDGDPPSDSAVVSMLETAGRTTNVAYNLRDFAKLIGTDFESAEKIMTRLINAGDLVRVADDYWATPTVAERLA